MNASSRYREVKSFILNIYCNCSKHCIKMHTDYIHKYCILLKYRYVLERRRQPSKNNFRLTGLCEATPRGWPRLFVYICMVQTEPTGEKSRRKPKM